MATDCGADSNIIVFDGECNLCAWSVKFVLAHEADHTLRFAALQSPAGVRLMRKFGFDPGAARTFVLIADGMAYVRSDAAIRVTAYFRGAWRLLGTVRLMPRIVRDWAYDIVARNRYRWFGRRDSCLMPTPDLKARFVHE